jgi:hypothetical protein
MLCNMTPQETRVAAQPNSDTGPALEMLRHTVATLAYRAGRAVQGAPVDFGQFRASETTRTPGEILAHIGDLLDWARCLADGRHEWHDSAPLPWVQEVTRFFAGLDNLDKRLASGGIGSPIDRLFQGPIADALTHIGQIAMLRRLAGSPVRGENYFKADIVAGRVGPQQSSLRKSVE